MSESDVDPRPTLRTIAYLTGLGVSTVSRALKDGPEIALETRARVKLIAQQVGYRPNRAGVRLRTGKSNVIALVLNPQDGGTGFFSNMIYGISDALAGSQYHLVVTPYSLSDPMSPIRYIVETASADGVIISRMQRDDPRVRYMVEKGMPFVTHGRTEMNIEHCYFDHDNEAYAIQALKLLKDRGRTRVTVISPPPSLAYHGHTMLGFDEGLAAFALNYLPLSSVSTDSKLEDIRDAVAELASSSAPPDGIVCSSIAAAPAVIAGMQEHGLVCGKDYDLVGKPRSDQILFLAPEIICLEEDFRKAGHELARMLIAHVSGTPASQLQQLEIPEPQTLRQATE